MPPLALWLAKQAGQIALSLVMKYVLPSVITWLHSTGHVNAAEEMAAKGAVAVANEIRNLKTYNEYPDPNKKNGL